MNATTIISAGAGARRLSSQAAALPERQRFMDGPVRKAAEAEDANP